MLLPTIRYGNELERKGYRYRKLFYCKVYKVKIKYERSQDRSFIELASLFI